MRHILVASDLSDRSAPALARGLRLAADHDAAVTLLHVTDDAAPARDGICDRMRAQLPTDARVTCRVVAGDPDEAIAQAAAEGGADLIVMGIPRARRFPDSIAGTTAERVLAASTCPVAVIRRPGDAPWHRLMLAGQDDRATPHVIAGANALRLLEGVDLTVLQATNLPAPPQLRTGGLSGVDLQRIDMLAMEEMAHRLRGHLAGQLTAAAHREFVLRHGAAAPAILDLQSAQHFDLVVMGARGQGTLARRICGSTSAQIIRDLTTDVICIPEG